MPCTIYQHEPQIAVYFSPALHVVMNGPDTLGSLLPGVYSLPIQGVQVKHDSRRINHHIVLPVVDKHLDLANHLSY